MMNRTQICPQRVYILSSAQLSIWIICLWNSFTMEWIWGKSETVIQSSEGSFVLLETPRLGVIKESLSNMGRWKDGTGTEGWGKGPDVSPSCVSQWSCEFGKTLLVAQFPHLSLMLTSRSHIVLIWVGYWLHRLADGGYTYGWQFLLFFCFCFLSIRILWILNYLNKTEVCLCLLVYVADLRYLIIMKPAATTFLFQGYWVGIWQPECPLPLYPVWL